MKKASKFFSHLFLTVMSLFSIFPLYWMLVSATNTTTDISAGRLLPGMALLQNYAAVMDRLNLWQCLWNSLLIAFVSTFLTLVVSSMAGYAFEIYHDKHKDRLMSVVLSGMMIPSIATMIPLYKMMGTLSLMNTIWACVLPNVGYILIIYLFRQSSRNFPREVIQAARVDGLSEMGIFLRIFVPMMSSTYATGFIISFMRCWNNYMWMRLVLRKNEMLTLPILVSNLTSGYTPDYGAVMLANSLCTLPMLIIFLSMQKAFENSVTGSVKG